MRVQKLKRLGGFLRVSNSKVYFESNHKKTYEVDTSRAVGYDFEIFSWHPLQILGRLIDGKLEIVVIKRVDWDRMPKLDRIEINIVDQVNRGLILSEDFDRAS